MKQMCHYVFALSVGGLAAAASAQELLSNGNFENMPNYGSGVSGDAGYSALTGAQIPGWTIEPGHAVTIHNTVIYPTIAGNFSVNTDGEGFNGVNANFYQDFATTIGQAYTLQYDWQGWLASGTQLNISVVDTLTSLVLASNSYSFDAALHHEVVPFLGTGNTVRLRIEEQSGFNDNTFIVDNFSVVPTPGAAALLGLGGLLGGRRRR
jgi:MYXO-CTERM domain-containing protein